MTAHAQASAPSSVFVHHCGGRVSKVADFELVPGQDTGMTLQRGEALAGQDDRPWPRIPLGATLNP